MPDLVTLSSVPYNPYNTSFAEFALKGYGLGQADRFQAENVNEQNKKLQLEQQAQMAQNLQQVDNNQYRAAAFSHELTQDTFKNQMEQARMDIAGRGMNIQEADASQRRFAEGETNDLLRGSELARIDHQKAVAQQLEDQHSLFTQSSGLRAMENQYATEHFYDQKAAEQRDAEFKHLAISAKAYHDMNPSADPLVKMAAGAQINAGIATQRSALDAYRTDYLANVKKNGAITSVSSSAAPISNTASTLASIADVTPETLVTGDWSVENQNKLSDSEYKSLIQSSPLTNHIWRDIVAKGGADKFLTDDGVYKLRAATTAIARYASGLHGINQEVSRLNKLSETTNEQYLAPETKPLDPIASNISDQIFKMAPLLRSMIPGSAKLATPARPSQAPMDANIDAAEYRRKQNEELQRNANALRLLNLSQPGPQQKNTPTTPIPTISPLWPQ